MHRLVGKSQPTRTALSVARRALSSSTDTRRAGTIRPLQHLSQRTGSSSFWNTNRRQRISTPFQNCVLSTGTTSGGGGEEEEGEPDLSKLSHRDMEQLALKYARQANPAQAQWVLNRLVQVSQEARSSIGGGGGSTQPSEEELVIIRSSVVDAWFEYQKKQIDMLEECVRQGDSLSVLRDRLEEICQAAESASELIEPQLQVQSNAKNTGSKVSSHHVLAILKSWANACEATRVAGLTSKSGDWSGIPQRALHILSSYLTVTGNNPSTELVNQVLKAWAYSGEHLRGTMAEQVFQKFLQGTKDEPGLPPPNGETFRYMIRAWGWSKEKRSAFTATGHFMRMMRLLEIGHLDMEPKLVDYKILFQAWTTAEDKNAPSKVRTVLQLVDTAYRKGFITTRPDLECYRFALETMSRRVNVPEVGELLDQTLSEMKKERMIIPNTECYGAAILTWKHVAMGRECEDRERAVQRTDDLLQEMIDAFHRTTTVTVRPTTEHYNHVLEALTMSKAAKATQRAETILNALEKAADRAVAEEQGNSEGESNRFDDPVGLAPNADSYKHALVVLRNSKSHSKVQEAQALINRFQSRAHQLRTVSSETSMVEVMSAFISVCARGGSGSKDEAQNMEIMFTALRTPEVMRALDLVPDSTTYAALLEACDTLVHDGQDRQRILESIFIRACDGGYVDHVVLENFKAASSTYLYAKLVVAPSQEVENMKVVPESWTRNVQGFSANSKGGRKVLPLTIEGQFTFTKAAAEYKMRKLRKQANKHLLEGGRMK